jgi:hypothetical protein
LLFSIFYAASSYPGTAWKWKDESPMENELVKVFRVLWGLKNPAKDPTAIVFLKANVAV